MNGHGLMRTAAAMFALMLAGVPVATRICGFRCEAAPAVHRAEAASRPHCPAHPPRPQPVEPYARPDPCGHDHAGDGALLTASASLARNGARQSETPAVPMGPASGSSLLVPCAWQTDFDRRPAIPPPAAHRLILRL